MSNSVSLHYMRNMNNDEIHIYAGKSGTISHKLNKKTTTKKTKAAPSGKKRTKPTTTVKKSKKKGNQNSDSSPKGAGSSVAKTMLSSVYHEGSDS